MRTFAQSSVPVSARADRGESRGAHCRHRHVARFARAASIGCSTRIERGRETRAPVFLCSWTERCSSRWLPGPRPWVRQRKSPSTRSIRIGCLPAGRYRRCWCRHPRRRRHPRRPRWVGDCRSGRGLRCRCSRSDRLWPPLPPPPPVDTPPNPPAPPWPPDAEVVEPLLRRRRRLAATPVASPTAAAAANSAAAMPAMTPRRVAPRVGTDPGSPSVVLSVTIIFPLRTHGRVLLAQSSGPVRVDHITRWTINIASGEATGYRQAGIPPRRRRRRRHSRPGRRPRCYSRCCDSCC